MKLSVIVPVYNMEKYLEQCIESILSQTYKDYEIILVNDGSKDKSTKICNEYARKNINVKVIHKKNGGAADSRNIGLENITGDYIFFIDSDDFLNERDAFYKIITRINRTNADILNFGFKKYFEDKNISRTYFDKIKNNMPSYICNSNDSFKYLIKKSLFLSSPWNKVIKRELFQKHNLYFKKGIYSEDIEWCARLAMSTKRFDFINTDFYSYRQRKSSISKNMSNKNIKDLKDSIITCCKYAENYEEENKSYFFNYIAYQYGTFLVCQAKANCNNQIQAYIDEMSNYQYLLDYKLNKKIKILYYLNKVIGYKNLCNLIRKFYNK